MSLEEDKMRVAVILQRIGKGTVAERLAWHHLKVYENECLQILGSGATADMKRKLTEEAHTRYLGMLCNLVEPMDPDEPPTSADAHTAQETAAALSLDLHEVLTALAGIIKAWDEVDPIGWVARKKAEPGVILGAVKQARAVLRRYSHCLPT